MKTYALENAATGEVLARHVRQARSPWLRAVGFLSWTSVTPEEGLWFDDCSAIHTIGMRASLEVIFLDREHVVIGIMPCVPPNRVRLSWPNAQAVVELGVVQRRRVNVGERLRLRCDCENK
jgi:uncharacterized membrane protein (UPF0127 family)